MLRTLPIIVALLLLSSVAWGAGEACPIAGTQDWGPIGTITATNCDGEAVPPDADDLVLIPDGSTVDIVNDITFAGNPANEEGALSVLSGGTLQAYTSETTNNIALNITFANGQDDVSTDSHDDVALWVEAGGTLILQGSYLERFSDGTPALRETVSEANGNIWTVDLMSICADNSNSLGGTVGGAGDCATGVEERTLGLAYTNARNNPLDGTTEENYLQQALQQIDPDNEICFITGMDAGHCYGVSSLDTGAGGVYGVVIDSYQVADGWDSDNWDNAAYPLAQRENVLTSALTGYAPAPGDTCVETTGDVLATLGDGGYVGAFFWLCEDGAVACDERPIRISKAKDDEHCDGTESAGHAALHFPPEAALRKTYDDEAVVVITAFGAGRGDKFVVMSPVNIIIEDTRTNGQGKLILEGDITMHAVTIGGSGIVLFDGATVDLDMVHVRSAGDDGTPAVKFIDLNSVNYTWGSVVGGPVTTDGNGVEFADITGTTNVTSVALRYIGGEQFYSSGSAMGPALFEMVSCERIGHAEAASSSCILNTNDDWSYVGVKDLFVTDGTDDTGGNILYSLNVPLVANGVAIYGQPEGGFVKQNPVDEVMAYNVFARGVDTTRVLAAGTWAGNHLSHCDIQDMTLGLGNAAASFMSALGATLSNCLIKDISINRASILKSNDVAGPASFTNNIFVNATTSLAGNTNYLINVTLDDVTTTVTTIEDNSFLWETGETTLFTEVVLSDSTTGDVINFGGNLIDGFNNASATADAPAIGFNLDATAAAVAELRDGRNNCVSYATASGAGSPTVEYVDDADQYSLVPITGTAPDYDAVNLGKGALRAGSYLAEKRCGARTGPHQPGMGPGHDWLYERMGIPKPRRAVNLKPSKAF